MITLALHSDTHIALRGSFDYRAEIKALAPPPDVRWCAEAKAWLLHVALLDKLFFYLGDSVAPASVDFWCTCPLPVAAQPVRKRRTTQQVMAEKRSEQAAAAKFGSAFVDAMHKEQAC